jgi:membrane-associated phospholipid phosphatase
VTGRSRFAPARDWLLVAAGGLVVLVLCGLVAHDGTVPGWEQGIFHAVNDLPGALYPLLWPFQQFGNLVIAVVVAAIVAVLLRRWEVVVAVLVAAVLKLRLERVVKDVVERARPETSIGDVHLRGDVSAGGLSFVSGHAVITAAVAGLLTPILPGRWKVVPWVVVALNGLTRIYVGAHNPLDILGGIGLGLFIAGLLNAGLVVLRSMRQPTQSNVSGSGPTRPAAP